MTVLVRLNEHSCRQIKWVANERVTRARRSNRAHRFGAGQEDDPYALDLIGAAGECAVAAMLGVDWKPAVEPDTGIGDVNGWQVKTTPHVGGHLLLHREYADLDRFVLVVGSMPWFEVMGWVYGYEGKQSQWWRRLQAGRPCYCCPQRRLNPTREMLGARKWLK